MFFSVQSLSSFRIVCGQTCRGQNLTKSNFPAKKIRVIVTSGSTQKSLYVSITPENVDTEKLQKNGILSSKLKRSLRILLEVTPAFRLDQKNQLKQKNPYDIHVRVYVKIIYHKHACHASSTACFACMS